MSTIVNLLLDILSVSKDIEADVESAVAAIKTDVGGTAKLQTILSALESLVTIIENAVGDQS